MKYLILGSSGQIGSHLKKYIVKQNQEIVEFDLINNSYEDLRITNNTLLEKHIDESDFVYFLAFDVGGSRYLKTYQNTFEFIQNNVSLMENTFYLLKKYNKPFIFSSTQMSNMDYSPYGTLKRLGEYYTNILNGLVVKFWNVYGIEHDEEKSHVITDFIKKAILTKKIDMLTDGLEERQFLYANDCSKCLFTLSGIFNNLDKTKEYHITNFKWSNIINIALEIQKNITCDIVPGVTKDTIQQNKRNEPNPYILNFWNPETSIEIGINNMCDYYLEYYKKEILL